MPITGDIPARGVLFGMTGLLAAAVPAWFCAWECVTGPPCGRDAEDAMLPVLLLSTALASGQAPPQDAPAPAAETAPAPSPPPAAPDRWLLMKEMQGTWAGWLLDSQHAQLYGWVQA